MSKPSPAFMAFIRCRVADAYDSHNPSANPTTRLSIINERVAKAEAMPAKMVAEQFLKAFGPEEFHHC